MNQRNSLTILASINSENNKNKMQEEQQNEKAPELTLQVFQYTDYDYIIGLVNLEQLNSSDYAFTINHPLAIVFDDDIMSYRIYEDTIVDSTQVYNLTKHKVISMFTPTENLINEYFELAYRISERDNFVDEDTDQDFNEFLEIGQIQ